MPCTGTCPAGTNNCSGNCVANDSVNGCGPQCVACKVPANAKATCDGTSCGFECVANYKKCGDACIPMSGCCSADDCGDPGECQIKACNPSSHTCMPMPADASVSCGRGHCSGGKCVQCSSADECDDKICQTKACDSSGSCVYTKVPEGKTSASCGSGLVCSRDQRCVSCVSAEQCSGKGLDGPCKAAMCTSANTCTSEQLSGSTAQCSGANSCVNGQCKPLCGNGTIDPGEDCEVSAFSSPVDSRYCDQRSCKFIRVFRAGCTGANCGPSCSVNQDCPRPHGTEAVVCGGNSAGSFCEYSCGTAFPNADCPPGSHCDVYICNSDP
jgi:hypothetical protein